MDGEGRDAIFRRLASLDSWDERQTESSGAGETEDNIYENIGNMSSTDSTSSPLTTFENITTQEQDLPLNVCIGVDASERLIGNNKKHATGNWPPDLTYVLNIENIVAVFEHLPITGYKRLCNIFACRSTLVRWLEGRKNRGQRYVNKSQLVQVLTDRSMCQADATLLCSLIDSEGLGQIDINFALHSLAGHRLRLMPAYFNDDLLFRSSLMRTNPLMPGKADIFSDKTDLDVCQEMMTGYLRSVMANGWLMPFPFDRCWQSVYLARRAVYKRLLNLKLPQSIEGTTEHYCAEGDMKIELSTNQQSVNKLIDGEHDTYWESNGAAGTHWIRIRMPLDHVASCVKIDVDTEDSSYMPSEVQLMMGKEKDDMQELSTIVIPPKKTGFYAIDLIKFCQTSSCPYIQLNIKKCYNGGCDTRIRGLLVERIVEPKSTQSTVGECCFDWQMELMMSLLDVCLVTNPQLVIILLSQTELTLARLSPLSWCPAERIRLKDSHSGVILDKMAKQIDKFMALDLDVSSRARLVKCLVKLSMITSSVSSILRLILYLLNLRKSENVVLGAELADVLETDLFDLVCLLKETCHQVKLRSMKKGEPIDFPTKQEWFTEGEDKVLIKMEPKNHFNHFIVNSLKIKLADGYKKENVRVYWADKELETSEGVLSNEIVVTWNGLNVMSSLEIEIKRENVPLKYESVNVRLYAMNCRFGSSLEIDTIKMLSNIEPQTKDMITSLLMCVLEMIKSEYQLTRISSSDSIVDISGLDMDLLVQTFQNIFCEAQVLCDPLRYIIMMEIVNISVRAALIKIDNETTSSKAADLFGHLAIMVQSNDIMAIPASCILKNGASFFISGSQSRRDKFLELLAKQEKTALETAIYESLAHYFTERRIQDDSLLQLPTEPESNAVISVDNIISLLSSLFNEVMINENCPSRQLLNSLLYEIYSWHCSTEKEKNDEFLYYAVTGFVIQRTLLVLENNVKSLESTFTSYLYLALTSFRDVAPAAAKDFIETVEPLLETILKRWPDIESCISTKENHSEWKKLHCFQVSSSHPCKADIHSDNTDKAFKKVGATMFKIEFNEKCQLSDTRGDRLIFYTSYGTHRFVKGSVAKDKLSNWPKSFTLVSQDVLYFSYRSTECGDFDESGSDSDVWGYEFTVKAKTAMKPCEIGAAQPYLLILKLLAKICALTVSQLQQFITNSSLTETQIWKHVFSGGKFDVKHWLYDAARFEATNDNDDKQNTLASLMKECEKIDSRPILGGNDGVKLVRATFAVLLYNSQDINLEENKVFVDESVTKLYSIAVTLNYQMMNKKQKLKAVQDLQSKELFSGAIIKALYLLEYRPAMPEDQSKLIRELSSFLLDSPVDTDAIEKTAIQFELHQKQAAAAYKIGIKILESSSSNLKLFFLRQWDFFPGGWPSDLTKIGSWAYLCQSSVALDRNWNGLGKSLIECLRSNSHLLTQLQFLVYVCHYFTTMSRNEIRITRYITKGKQTRWADDDMMLVLERLINAAFKEMSKTTEKPLEQELVTESLYAEFGRRRDHPTNFYNPVDQTPNVRWRQQLFMAIHCGDRSVCDGCSAHFEKSPRYRCIECTDVDLCSECFNIGLSPYEHTSEHVMTRLEHVCDQCRDTIAGTRYNCKQCGDFDLCRGCYLGWDSKSSDIIQSHKNKHHFEELAAFQYHCPDPNVLQLSSYLQPLSWFTLTQLFVRIGKTKNRRLNDFIFDLLVNRLKEMVLILNISDYVDPNLDHLIGLIGHWFKINTPTLYDKNNVEQCIVDCATVLRDGGGQCLTNSYGLLSKLISSYGPELSDSAFNRASGNPVQGSTRGRVSLGILFALCHQHFQTGDLLWPSMISALFYKLASQSDWVAVIQEFIKDKLDDMKSRHFTSLILIAFPCVWYPGMPCTIEMEEQKTIFIDDSITDGTCSVLDDCSRKIYLVRQDRFRPNYQALAFHENISEIMNQLLQHLPRYFRLKWFCSKFADFSGSDALTATANNMILGQALSDACRSTGFDININIEVLETASLLLATLGQRKFESKLIKKYTNTTSLPFPESDSIQAVQRDFDISTVILCSLPPLSASPLVAHDHSMEYIVRNLVERLTSDSCMPSTRLIQESARRFCQYPAKIEHFLKQWINVRDRPPLSLEAVASMPLLNEVVSEDFKLSEAEPLNDLIETTRPEYQNELLLKHDSQYRNSSHLLAVELILKYMVDGQRKKSFHSFCHKINEALEILYSRRFLADLLVKDEQTAAITEMLSDTDRLFQLVQVLYRFKDTNYSQVVQTVCSQFQKDEDNLPSLVYGACQLFSLSMPENKLVVVGKNKFHPTTDSDNMGYVFIAKVDFGSHVDFIRVKKLSKQAPWFHETADLQVWGKANKWQSLSGETMVMYGNKIILRLSMTRKMHRAHMNLYDKHSPMNIKLSGHSVGHFTVAYELLCSLFANKQEPLEKGLFKQLWNFLIDLFTRLSLITQKTKVIGILNLLLDSITACNTELLLDECDLLRLAPLWKYVKDELTSGNQEQGSLKSEQVQALLQLFYKVENVALGRLGSFAQAWSYALQQDTEHLVHLFARTVAFVGCIGAAIGMPNKATALCSNVFPIQKIDVKPKTDFDPFPGMHDMVLGRYSSDESPYDPSELSEMEDDTTDEDEDCSLYEDALTGRSESSVSMD